MTRKHYETIATTLGGEMRREIRNSPTWHRLFRAASTLADDLRATNPRFDRERFLEYVLDVAEYRRGLDGKKIA